MRMDAKDRIAFVDLQGFISIDTRFILKEICFSINDRQHNNSDNNTFNPTLNHHHIFLPPHAWNQLSESCRKSALWLTRNHHGLHWSQGEIDYNEISECVKPLLEQNLLIYVKGEQKIDWLKDICNNHNINCRNIEELGCDIRLGTIDDDDDDYNDRVFYHCNKHSRAFNRCALQNCEIIKYWYNNNYIADDEC